MLTSLNYGGFRRKKPDIIAGKFESVRVHDYPSKASLGSVGRNQTHKMRFWTQDLYSNIGFLAVAALASSVTFMTKHFWINFLYYIHYTLKKTQVNSYQQLNTATESRL